MSPGEQVPSRLVTHDQYSWLLDTPLGVTDFLETELRDNPKALAFVRANQRNEATYAAVASWAVWKPIVRGKEGVRDRSHDMSRLGSYDTLTGVLHADVVLVAFNKGLVSSTNVDGRPADREPAWSNFHSGNNDYKLAAAIEEAAHEQRVAATVGGRVVRDWFTGAYITDFYKGLPTQGIPQFEEFCDLLDGSTRARVDAEMVRLLRLELDTLGATTVVAIGGDVRELLAEHLPDVRTTTAPLMHYAARKYDPVVYRDQVLAVNAELQTMAWMSEGSAARSGDKLI